MEKLTVKFYLAPGVRNRKFYLVPGMRNGKIYLALNDSFEKFCLAVKGLKTKFLRHFVSGRETEPDPEKVRAVIDWPTPRNLTEVRGFVALASYYCRFVGSFAEITRSIHLLTQKNRSFIWKDTQQEAFEHLKHCLVTALFLSLPRDEGRYMLDSDASNEALGLVLQQEQDSMLKVIPYESRALQPAERSYCTTPKKLLAVIYGLKHFRQFLLRRRFVCRNDHVTMTSLFRTPEPVGQQARNLDLFGEYDMKILHQPGASHQNSDVLSRHPCEREMEEIACRQCRRTGREKELCA